MPLEQAPRLGARDTARDEAARRFAAQVFGRGPTLPTQDERLRAICDRIRDGLIVQAASGIISDCNPAAERMLGLGAGELVGRRLAHLGCSFLCADGAPLPVESLPAWAALRSGAPVADSTVGVRYRDGRVAWFSVDATPLRGEGPDAAPCVATCLRDISEAREADAEKRVLLSRFLQAQSLGHIGSWEVDLTTDARWWSDEIFNILELPPDTEPSVKALLSAIPPSDRVRMTSAFEHARETGESYDIKHRVLTRDGRSK